MNLLKTILSISTALTIAGCSSIDSAYNSLFEDEQKKQEELKLQQEKARPQKSTLEERLPDTQEAKIWNYVRTHYDSTKSISSLNVIYIMHLEEGFEVRADYSLQKGLGEATQDYFILFIYQKGERKNNIEYADFDLDGLNSKSYNDHLVDAYQNIEYYPKHKTYSQEEIKIAEQAAKSLLAKIVSSIKKAKR